MNYLPQRKLTRTLVALFCLILNSIPVSAATLEKSKVKALKEAVVFIRNGDSSGSGFLVRRHGESGTIVTNQHVVEGIRKNGAVELFFNAGQANQRKMRGTLEAAIPSLDLALIKIKAKNLPRPISMLEARPQVVETESVFALGFPFGNQLATNRETPRITISTGTVSSIRSDTNDQALYIQTDASINPGNSGGPVVDRKGRLVGIAVSKIADTSIGFIIPKRRLAQLLKGQLYNISINVKKKWLDSERWEYHLSTKGKVYSPLFAEPEAGYNIMLARPKTIRSAILRNQNWGRINGSQPINLKLGKIHSERFSSGALKIPSRHAGKELIIQPYIKYKDRVSYQAPLWLTIDENEPFSFAYDGPNRTSVREASPTPKAKNKNNRDNDSYARGKSSPKHKSKRGKKTKKEAPRGKAIVLPGSIDSIALAGGGRFLAFGVDADNSAVLFDLKQHKLVPINIQMDEPTLIAGDKDHIYLAGIDSGQLIKWSIATSKVVRKGFSPGGAAIRALATGWGSKGGDMLIITNESFEIVDTTQFKIKKLKWISAAYDNESKPHVSRDEKFQARPSSSGKLFTFWGASSGFHVLRVRGQRVTHYRKHAAAGFVIPSRNGNNIYTGMKGAYSNKLGKLDLSYLKGGQLIPSIQGNHIMRVTHKGKVRVSIIKEDSGDIVETLRIPELKADEHPYSYHRVQPTGDQRLWLDEANNQLVIIPESNDRVVVHKLTTNLRTTPK